MSFLLDPRLATDTVKIGTLELCYVGLLNDARYPWLVLVPQKTGLVEVIDLDESARNLMWREIDHCSQIMRQLYPEAKLNIGALGNIVRQLHIHVIARHEADAAWPGPVWGVGKAKTYSDAGLADMTERFRKLL